MYGYEIFHDELMLALINSARRSDSAHAYIFEGASGMRTHECAALLAAALTCRHTDSAPCGTCPSCVTAKAETSPDIIYVNKKDKKSIGVEPVRELTQDASVKPFESEHKVYIIEEADLMTEPAQNALLKTLEEPPSFVTFILLVQDTSPLLTTVLSRCVLVKFPPISESRLREYISRTYPDETRTDFLCRYAQGNPGAVDEVIADDGFEAVRTSSFQMLPKLLAPQLLSVYEIADYMKENSDKSDMIIDFWLDYMRDILLIRQNSESLIVNADFAERLNAISTRLTDEFTVRTIEELIDVKQMSRRYVNLRAMTMRLCFNIKSVWKI
jgi:DNA polymerase-3 subunit delta'